MTASTILGTDTSKNIISLPIATYPTLTELSYVRGLSSAIQIQLNAKQGTISSATNITCGNLSGNTLTSSTLTASTVLLSDASKNIVSSGVSSTNLSTLNGLLSSGNSTTLYNGNLRFTSNDIVNFNTSNVYGNLNIGISAGTSTDGTVKGRIFLNSELDSLSVLGNITNANLSPSTILGTDTSKNIISLPIATYPNLTELSYVRGLSSAIQTQIDTKQGLISSSTNLTCGNLSGTTLTSSTLTASTVLLSNASKNIVSSGVPSTNLSTLNGLLSSGNTTTLYSQTCVGGQLQLSGNTLSQTINGDLYIGVNNGYRVYINSNINSLNVLGTINNTNLTASTVLLSDASKNIVSSGVSSTNLSTLNGLLSSGNSTTLYSQTCVGGQLQLSGNTLSQTINGDLYIGVNNGYRVYINSNINSLNVLGTINNTNLTASTVLLSDASKNIVSSGVSSTNLSTLNGLLSSGNSTTIYSTMLITGNTKFSTGLIEQTGVGDLEIRTASGYRIYLNSPVNSINNITYIKFTYKTINSNYTITSDDNYIICTAALTITLPASGTSFDGKVFVIKHAAASGNLIINVTGSDKLDNGTTKTLTSMQTITIISVSTNWYIV